MPFRLTHCGGKANEKKNYSICFGFPNSLQAGINHKNKSDDTAASAVTRDSSSNE